MKRSLTSLLLAVITLTAMAQKNIYVNFCPGWKAYFKSLDNNAQQVYRDKYNLT